MHHVGTFPQLADQMTNFTSDFDRQAAGYSPDRVDALVWAAIDLLIEQMSNWGLFELYRRRAAAIEARKKGAKNHRRSSANQRMATNDRACRRFTTTRKFSSDICFKIARNSPPLKPC
jgi:hypothetical protein